jgi:hypothetical protein
VNIIFAVLFIFLCILSGKNIVASDHSWSYPNEEKPTDSAFQIFPIRRITKKRRGFLTAFNLISEKIAPFFCQNRDQRKKTFMIFVSFLKKSGL